MKKLFVLIALCFASPLALKAQAATVNLTWQDSINPAGTGYNVRRGNSATACTAATVVTDTCTLLNNVPLAVKTFTDAPPLGSNYYYYVRATNGSIESVNSNVAIVSLTAPSAVTLSCTITITNGVVNGTCK